MYTQFLKGAKLLRGLFQMSKKTMTKAQALQDFRYYIKPFIKRGDAIAAREAWNNWTDALCKEGAITLNQYENWGQPF